MLKYNKLKDSLALELRNLVRGSLKLSMKDKGYSWRTKITPAS